MIALKKLFSIQCQTGNNNCAIAFYNQVMKAFDNSQKMNVPVDWTEYPTKRVGFVESLSGRDRLQEALKNLGFELG
ncbi:MAG: hypothetical protein NHB32_08640 [Fischerella sp. CENA71]|nr:hypothetical protein [Fischerella sp. CENA71]